MSADADLPDLLTAVAKRDRAAFRALYAAQSAKLFAIVLRICRDRAIAEDALQDAFVEVWRKAESFDPARGKVAVRFTIRITDRSGTTTEMTNCNFFTAGEDGRFRQIAVYMSDAPTTGFDAGS